MTWTVQAQLISCNNSFSMLKVFPGNSDRNSIVRHALSPVIFARFVRIYPGDYEGYRAMRVEFYGCYKGKVIVTIIEKLYDYFRLEFSLECRETSARKCVTNPWSHLRSRLIAFQSKLEDSLFRKAKKLFKLKI